MIDSADSPMRILVVDDEEIVQSLVHDALEDEGYEVVTAGNGRAALERIAEQRFDLLITDIRMPGMSGIELVEQADKLDPEMGIVYMTGYASLNSAKDAIKQGVLDYIMKPFELHEIRMAVRNACQKLAEIREQGSSDQLEGLSGLSSVLFGAGDRRSLIISSLKFAMMHIQCEAGAAMFHDVAEDQWLLTKVQGDEETQRPSSANGLTDVMNDPRTPGLTEPVMFSSPKEHPLCISNPHLDLCSQFESEEKSNQEFRYLTVPVRRGADFYALLIFVFNGDTFRTRQSDLKFLTITASQLATTLENLRLLEETQAAYARLRELQDETIELEKMATRGEMSAEIGHELNNFLGVVMGNVQLLEVYLRKEKYDQLPQYIEPVVKTLDKMKVFTGNLMELRTIASTMEAFNLDQLLAEVVDYLRPQKRFRGITITLDDTLPDTPFKGDSIQIQQLLYNLMNNAADATIGRDTREINISLEQQPGADRFTLRVADTGVGIDPEYLAKAFSERFTTKESGHGFGLMVCKRIIEKHEGHLDIASTPNVGTEISITFPLAQNAPEPAPALA